MVPILRVADLVLLTLFLADKLTPGLSWNIAKWQASMPGRRDKMATNKVLDTDHAMALRNSALPVVASMILSFGLPSLAFADDTIMPSLITQVTAPAQGTRSSPTPNSFLDKTFLLAEAEETETINEEIMSKVSETPSEESATVEATESTPEVADVNTSPTEETLLASDDSPLAESAPVEDVTSSVASEETDIPAKIEAASTDEAAPSNESTEEVTAIVAVKSEEPSSDGDDHSNDNKAAETLTEANPVETKAETNDVTLGTDEKLLAESPSTNKAEDPVENWHKEETPSVNADDSFPIETQEAVAKSDLVEVDSVQEETKTVDEPKVEAKTPSEFVSEEERELEEEEFVEGELSKEQIAWLRKH